MDGVILGSLIVVSLGIAFALYVHFITRKNDEKHTS